MSFKEFRYMIYVIVSFFLVSWFIPYPVTTIDPEIKPYYNEYIGIVKQYCKDDQYHNDNFKLVFDDGIKKTLSGGEIGVCQPFPNAFKISINRTYWKSASDASRFSLLCHELSHCQFEIPHFTSPYHYMYYADTSIPKELVIYQLKEILKYKCNKD